MNARMDTSRAIIAFLAREILNDEGASIGEDDELIAQGLIDSMGIVRLMVHLQKLYGVRDFDRSDLTLDNFRSVSRIAKMVDRYRSVREEATTCL